MNASACHGSCHLKIDDLYDATAQCPVCESTLSRRAVLKIQADPEIWLLHCSVCRAASASWMPRPEVLHEIYRDYYVGKEKQNTMSNADRFARHILHYATKLVFADKKANIIDYGGGDGALALALAHRILKRHPRITVQIAVVDYFPPVTTRDSRIRIERIDRLNELTTDAEIVLASAILEHIPQCCASIRELFSRLCPGGIFYARTPWVVPVARLFPNIDLTFPFHVHDMGGDFWNHVPKTFMLPVDVLRTGPSPIETGYLRNPIRSTVASVLKLPARFEAMFPSRSSGEPFWRLVGGWEMLLRRKSSAYLEGGSIQKQ